MTTINHSHHHEGIRDSRSREPRPDRHPPSTSISTCISGLPHSRPTADGAARDSQLLRINRMARSLR
jgi:hypothetical protein